ncbi:MAG: hypothetical protein DMG62_14990 [Acidobacteria bacterium]|nr:MAG: hypothetical protein DMG62_14990 [Acidobacteriota bacterium]
MKEDELLPLPELPPPLPPVDGPLPPPLLLGGGAAAPGVAEADPGLGPPPHPAANSSNAIKGINKTMGRMKERLLPCGIGTLLGARGTRGR